VAESFVVAWDKRDVDAAVELCHPEIEIATIAELLPGHDNAFAGREGARRWIELTAELWDVEFRHDDCERRVLDEHSVELVGEIEARSSGEQPDFVAITRSLWKISDGMLRRLDANVARATAPDERQA
jgi:hypothetical protein